MSDASGATLPEKPYHSQVDPAFSAAFNLVEAEEKQKTAGEGGDAAGAAGAGAAAPAAPAEGAAADGAAAAAPADGARPGALPSAADLIASLTAEQHSDAGAGDGAGAESGDAGVSGAGKEPVAGEGLDPATVAPLFGQATQQITDKMTETFKAQAYKEVEQEIDEAFIPALRLRPMQLVGMEVPSVRPGAKPDEKIKILDTQMARDWQETVTGLIEDEIEDKVKTKTEQVRPMTSVIQNSALMFQNNPDLIIGTKGFDQELAERFVRFAKPFEVKTAQGVIGYHGEVQQLINEIRADLAKERGAIGARAEDRAEQQRKAAALQARTPAGQFEAPQAGISSKSGMSGEPADDYADFWRATGLAGPSLSI